MSEIKVDTLTGKTTANDITVTVGATATMSLEQGLTKVWANNELSGTASVQDSFGQSGIVDDGSGKLTMSFSTAMSNANYSPAGMSVNASGATAYASSVHIGATMSTTQLQVYFAYTDPTSGAWYDVPKSGVTINGDLA